MPIEQWMGGTKRMESIEVPVFDQETPVLMDSAPLSLAKMYELIALQPSNLTENQQYMRKELCGQILMHLSAAWYEIGTAVDLIDDLPDKDSWRVIRSALHESASKVSGSQAWISRYGIE